MESFIGGGGLGGGGCGQEGVLEHGLDVVHAKEEPEEREAQQVPTRRLVLRRHVGGPPAPPLPLGGGRRGWRSGGSHWRGRGMRPECATEPGIEWVANAWGGLGHDPRLGSGSSPRAGEGGEQRGEAEGHGGEGRLGGRPWGSGIRRGTGNGPGLGRGRGVRETESTESGEPSPLGPGDHRPSIPVGGPTSSRRPGRRRRGGSTGCGSPRRSADSRRRPPAAPDGGAPGRQREEEGGGISTRHCAGRSRGAMPPPPRPGHW